MGMIAWNEELFIHEMCTYIIYRHESSGPGSHFLQYLMEFCNTKLSLHAYMWCDQFHEYVLHVIYIVGVCFIIAYFLGVGWPAPRKWASFINTLKSTFQ